VSLRVALSPLHLEAARVEERLYIREARPTLRERNERKVKNVGGLLHDVLLRSGAAAVAGPIRNGLSELSTIIINQ
jgi:hypothetical protein